MDENIVTENEEFTGTEESKVSTPDGKKGMNPLIPHLIALGGAVLVAIADFIPYLEISNVFFSRKVSLFSLVTETLDDTDRMLGGTGDKVVFALIIASMVFSLLTILFAGLKKMIPVIVFTILAALPMLMIGNAFIHYIGFVIAIAGAIWYKIIAPKRL